MTSKRAAGGRHRQGQPVPVPAPPDRTQRPARGERGQRPVREERGRRPVRDERADRSDRPDEAAVATVQFRQVRPATPPPRRTQAPAPPPRPAEAVAPPPRTATAPAAHALAPSAQAPVPTPQAPVPTPQAPSSPAQAPASPAQAPASVARARRWRGSIKVWVAAGVLAQVGLLAVTLLNQDAKPTTALAAPAGPTAAPTARPTRSEEQATRERRTGSDLAFSAVAGPSCPRDTTRSVNIIGAPGRAGWKDARAGGWTGAGCGEGFLFSDLTYDPAAAVRTANTFQWRFTTGLRGRHQCAVGVYIPNSGLAGQRVWYTVSDGFDKDARTVAEFTLDQRMRRGTWVAAPSTVTVTGGLVMVEIKDTGRGNTTGDQSMVAGPVRLSCA
ncbi:hypothetical protein HD597_004567 [Nonomuraea thailandensis]|uniref:Uncharacterized protein n=1 Tax=Nonomuraea thailandensis TaxID=1188745 RepID=A0A9X2K1Q9_9ACTN|nr:hypothetical protein [Nonomuraea thailandensis]MCP2357547.1 hypothetical protein [Nonomuraea thailandensis]